MVNEITTVQGRYSLVVRMGVDVFIITGSFVTHSGA